MLFNLKSTVHLAFDFRTLTTCMPILGEIVHCFLSIISKQKEIQINLSSHTYPVIFMERFAMNSKKEKQKKSERHN